MIPERGRPRFTPRSGLIVGGVLVALLAILVAILVHQHDPSPTPLWVRVGGGPAAVEPAITQSSPLGQAT
jgi:hypothetical protein